MLRSKATWEDSSERYLDFNYWNCFLSNSFNATANRSARKQKECNLELPSRSRGKTSPAMLEP